jgi:hypothetical protein
MLLWQAVVMLGFWIQIVRMLPGEVGGGTCTHMSSCGPSLLSREVSVPETRKVVISRFHGILVKTLEKLDLCNGFVNRVGLERMRPGGS